MLEAIDMDSYRVEKRAVQQIQLADANATIDPLPAEGGGNRPEPELDRLSNILRTFNDQWGNIAWSDGDRVRRLITEEIPRRSRTIPLIGMHASTRTSRMLGSSTTRRCAG